MLSGYEKLTEKKRLLSLPLLESPRTVRLKFKKIGTLQYISHLDLQRTFNRVISRACIPVWYTKGFNPHIKLVFSTPLSVGAQSVCEFLDIRIDREMACEEIMARLNRELTEELCIEEAYIPSSDFSEIEWASYRMELHFENISPEWVSVISDTLQTSPVNLIKKTKSGEKEIDIVPMIRSIDVTYDSEKGTIVLDAVLKASSAEYLNPEMLIIALKQKHGIFSGDLAKEWYTILRMSTLKADLSQFQ